MEGNKLAASTSEEDSKGGIWMFHGEKIMNGQL